MAENAQQSELGKKYTLAELAQAHREVLKEGGCTLLNFFTDVADTFSLSGGEEEQNEKDGLSYISQALHSFFEGNPELRSASPRCERPEDRMEFLPGEHKGVVIQMGLLSGETVYMNMYGGGLRTLVSADFANTDPALRAHHTGRTDAVLSKPMQCNVHMVTANGEKLFEMWLTYTYGGPIKLSMVRLNGEKLDFAPQIAPSAYQYQSLVTILNGAIRSLVQFIPSA